MESGIDKQDLPHIFERFYCVNNKVLGNPTAISDCLVGSGSYKGKNSSSESIGIGLALSKSIIESNNGYIGVESELGKGSVFTIKYFK